ncbi:hypothetical protein HR45_11260 [Shewanella mangrovi]|uniref:SnoaL-like domain-containing protein n=1 Tax=Shewanella mangrovi TaxID=1515746 RepID=A0A094JGT8_9GAMM|nr:hypothetical protein [Shewanella mangrovi]KFZ37249.1 hypothetical protein HR45_11260 [Shewanella mangrovi]
MINSARRFAAQEIAHRWFAYFEGVTEPLTDHLDLFTEDVRLIHARRTLLADGKAQLAAWLKQVPAETSSHLIHEFALQSLDNSSALLTMQVAYQALAHDQLIGAIIDYQAKVVFASDDSAQFALIQKSPIAANPALCFKLSFAEHRQLALLSQLGYQGQRGGIEWTQFCQEDAIVEQLKRRFNPLAAQDAAELTAQMLADHKMRIQLGDSSQTKCDLQLKDAGGRYLSIVAILD